MSNNADISGRRQGPAGPHAYTRDGPQGEHSEPMADLRALVRDRGPVIDCECGREHTIEELSTELEIPDGMRELLQEGSGRPRLDLFGSSYLLRIHRVSGAAEIDRRLETLHVLFHENWLVVFEDVDGVGTAWHPDAFGEGRYFPAEQAPLTLTLILEAAIDSFDAAALAIEDDTAECEAGIFEAFDNDIESVYRLGADASRLRSSLTALCRFVDRIPAPGTTAASDWSADTAAISEDAEDLRARMDSLHSRLTQLVTVYTALVAQQQNEDMKRVSAWAAILFTPSLVGAIYGMNFASMPELGWDLGYPVALLAMVVIGIVLYAVFRRQSWL